MWRLHRTWERAEVTVRRKVPRSSTSSTETAAGAGSSNVCPSTSVPLAPVTCVAFSVDLFMSMYLCTAQAGTSRHKQAQGIV